MQLQWHCAQWILAAPGATDVLVLEWNTRFLSLLPAVLRARRNGIRVVLWGHGYSKRPSRVRDLLRKVPGRFADALLFYERNTADRYRRARVGRAQIYHAANSLDDRLIATARERVLADEPAITEFRAQQGLSRGDTLLFIGRLYGENDIDFLLHAFALVLRQRPACRLVVIGDDRDQAPRLHALAGQLGLDAAVRWVGALYDEPGIARWACCADVFVYPRNVGLSLIHAFNYGLPVVAAGERRRHNPEIYALEHDVNGVFVDSEQPADYAQAVIALLDDEPRRRRLSEGALACIAQEFNMRNMVSQFVAAIRGH